MRGTRVKELRKVANVLWYQQNIPGKKKKVGPMTSQFWRAVKRVYNMLPWARRHYEVVRYAPSRGGKKAMSITGAKSIVKEL
jgi:hypothetical protein